MAIKTFATGEVLTAANTNTYLANSGLVYITEATATSGSTLSISNCFTSIYDAYRIVVNSYTAASAAALGVQMQVSGSPTATGYAFVYVSSSYVTTSTYSQIGATGSTSWGPLCITGGSDAGASAFDLFLPKVTNKTTIYGNRNDPRALGTVGTLSGYLDNNTSYDGILFTSGATISNLTVIVYGYRKA
jgi:hypothetical protein